MEKIEKRKKDTPSTITQLAAAMAALGMYGGENSDAEHEAEIERLGSAAYYRMLLVNALLRMVETEAMLADGLGVSHEQMGAAHQQARASAGVAEDMKKLLGFLHWQTRWRISISCLNSSLKSRRPSPVVQAREEAIEGNKKTSGLLVFFHRKNTLYHITGAKTHEIRNELTTLEQILVF